MQTSSDPRCFQTEYIKEYTESYDYTHDPGLGFFGRLETVLIRKVRKNDKV